MEEFYLPMRDGFKVSVLYAPVEHPKALVQIVHGAWEHKERYRRFIRLLNNSGYSLILHDQRGHGKSFAESHPKENRKEIDQRIEDIFQISSYRKEKNPNRKLFLLGHSMGSREARLYLRNHDERIDGLILTGAPSPRKAGVFGVFLAKMLYPFTGGKHGHNQLLKKMAGLDKPLDQWLSYSKDNIQEVEKDKEQLTTFDNEGYTVRFKRAEELAKPKKFNCRNPSLPILFACGEDDPVTGYEKGRKKSEKRLRQAGYKDIERKVYPKRRHEVLNEENHFLVDQAILNFLSAHC